MEIEKTKRGIRLRLKTLPNASQLEELNKRFSGLFTIEKGRLLHATGKASQHAKMECPLKQYWYI